MTQGETGHFVASRFAKIELDPNASQQRNVPGGDLSLSLFSFLIIIG